MAKTETDSVKLGFAVFLAANVNLAYSSHMKLHHIYAQKLTDFPSVGLITAPTPFAPLPRLSSYLGGPRIWIKRDDATHISSGGNKLRKLDRVLYAAVEQGADCLVSGGVPQSNSQRQVATAAAILGIEAHLCVFEGRVKPHSAQYDVSGNIVLNHLFGAILHPIPWAGDRNGPIDTLADSLRSKGKRPFVVPYGVSNAMGALSYSSVVAEIAHQSDDVNISPAAIIAASGSGGTQAGVTLGIQACLPNCAAICIDVDADGPRVLRDAEQYGKEAASLLGLSFEAERLRLETSYAGEAYGVVAESTIEAMTLLARLEAVVLDPVYTAKAMAGLIGMVREDQFSTVDDIVFIHTGGSPATFAYSDVIVEAIKAKS